MNKHIAIIGAGNGGQAFAGYLALQGAEVTIFDVFQATIDQLNELGGIQIEGNSKHQGFGKIRKATTDIGEATEGADIVLIVLPSTYHQDIALKMAPYLKDGQIVILNPHASLGPVEFRKTLLDAGCKADIVLGCTSTLLFACRAEQVGHVVVAGQKQYLSMAAYPSADNEVLKENFKDLIPEFHIVDDIIQVSLDNLNAFVHPAPTILNTGRIESHVPFEYYNDCTPSQGRYIDALDKERMALAAAFGLDGVMPLTELYKKTYRTHGDNMYEILTNNEDLKGIMGQQTLDTRYLTEDVPYSLEALHSLGKIAGIPTPCVDAMITVGRTLVPGMAEGRTLSNLGLKGVSKDEFLQMCRQSFVESVS